jgi:sn-glycerol 3-phosphate transport system ATP-binding protein
VALTGSVSLKTGDRIGIAIDQDAIHLYAADSGRNIAVPAASSTVAHA